MRYWHGGVPGLKPGDMVLAPEESGTDHTLSRWVPENPAVTYARRRDMVYMATDRNVARAYAACYPDGGLYLVDPVEEPAPDPDCTVPGMSWMCSAAVVTAVVDPVVLFRSKPFQTWLRFLNGPDDRDVPVLAPQMPVPGWEAGIRFRG